MRTDRKTLALEYLNAAGTHQCGKLEALFAPDIQFRGPSRTLTSARRRLAMPPHATWFRGAAAVRTCLETPRFGAFWTRGLRITHARANGVPAIVFYAAGPEDAAYRLHSIQLLRFAGGAVAEATTFIGAAYLHGFDVAPALAR